MFFLCYVIHHNIHCLQHVFWINQTLANVLLSWNKKNHNGPTMVFKVDPTAMPEKILPGNIVPFF